MEQPDLIEQIDAEIARYSNQNSPSFCDRTVKLLTVCKRALNAFEGAINTSGCPDHDHRDTKSCTCCDCDILSCSNCNCVKSLINPILLR